MCPTAPAYASAPARPTSSPWFCDGAEDTIDFARYLIQGIGQAVEGTRYHLNVTPDFERGDPTRLDTVRHILEQPHSQTA